MTAFKGHTAFACRKVYTFPLLILKLTPVRDQDV